MTQASNGRTNRRRLMSKLRDLNQLLARTDLQPDARSALVQAQSKFREALSHHDRAQNRRLEAKQLAQT